MLKESNEKVLKKIKKIKDGFKKEKQMFGFISNGSGSRYLIPGLLMKVMDLAAGKRYHTWFRKEFPDDIGEPYMYIQWLLLFYYRKEYESAILILKKLIHENIHAAPLILGKPLARINNFWYGSNCAEEGYISIEEIDNLSLVDAHFKEWLSEVYYKEEIQDMVKKFIDLRILLKETDGSAKRQEIIEKEYELFKGPYNNT
jgi:hypothetical protein